MNKQIIYKTVILLGSFLLLAGCTSVHTELFIPAEPEEVWAVLVDARGYEEWNPVLIPIEGELIEGKTVKYQMTEPNGKQSEIEAEVVKIIEEKELNQYGGMWGILTFDHKYVLEPVEGGTKVIQQEEYNGIGVWFWDNSWIEPAYNKVNKALSDRVAQLKKDEQK